MITKDSIYIDVNGNIDIIPPGVILEVSEEELQTGEEESATESLADTWKSMQVISVNVEGDTVDILISGNVFIPPRFLDDKDMENFLNTKLVNMPMPFSVRNLIDEKFEGYDITGLKFTLVKEIKPDVYEIRAKYFLDNEEDFI